MEQVQVWSLHLLSVISSTLHKAFGSLMLGLHVASNWSHPLKYTNINIKYPNEMFYRKFYFTNIKSFELSKKMFLWDSFEGVILNLKIIGECTT